MSARDELPEPPDPKVWVGAPVIEPRLAPATPDLVSDGGGLAFAPSVLDAQFKPLDPTEAPVVALLEQIDRSRLRAQPERIFRRRQPPPPLPVETRLAGWRVLAAVEDEFLYGRGQPPKLVTAMVKQGSRGHWSCLGASAARPIRASRDGMRASSWRVDPTFEIDPETTDLHLLLTEISRSSGVPTEDRLQTPEFYFDDAQMIVRLYVRPFEGYARGTPPRETPVILRLPQPLGTRRLLDGAIFWAPEPEPQEDIST